MSNTLYATTLRHVQDRVPFAVRSHLALGNAVPLFPNATFFNYVIIEQRRYWAANRNNNEANSLVAISVGPVNDVSVGKLMDIFVLNQESLGTRFLLAHVRWLVPMDLPMDNLRRSTWTQR